tara:strand:- start:1284 stop:2381 length:1098 start_codon:yes stop_codon:yes gene_type:complete
MNFNKDNTLYKELGIERNATSSDIKKAYHKLALQHHPDKGGNEDKFKKIQTAYEVLSNSEKRNKYDRFGLDSINNESDIRQNDIFNMFFSRANMKPQKRKGRDTIHILNITLKDLYIGKIQKLKIQRQVIIDEPITCINCNGSGYVKQIRRGPGFHQEINQGCARCSGNGKIFKYKKKEVILEIEIKKGMSIKDQIRFQGLGNELPNVITGDIIIKFKLIKHKTFVLKNNDLIMKMKISLVEALCGVKFTIKHLDDRVLNIRTTTEDLIQLQNGKIPFRYIENEGMPCSSNKRGNLIIAFIIEFPQSNYLDDIKKNALKEILPEPIHNIESTENVLELKKCDDSIFQNFNTNDDSENVSSGCSQM